MKIKKNALPLIVICLCCFASHSGFSQSSILRFTAKANSGTPSQVDDDFVMVDGTNTINLSSSNLTCTFSENDDIQNYQISIEDDFDGNGTMDQISFDLVVSAFINSTYNYSATQDESSVTIGDVSSLSVIDNIWGVLNTADLDAGQTISFTIENLSLPNMDPRYEIGLDGFNKMGLKETNAGHSHKLIIGEGINLNSLEWNNSGDYQLHNIENATITGAGSFFANKEFGFSSIGFTITINDTESGGFNDLSDYSLFSNANNFGAPYPDQTKVINHSEFSWEKVPRWLAVRNSQSMTDEEIIDIATHYQVVMLEKANYQGFQYIEDGIVDFATRLKAENPDITTLFYWNTVINYFGYEANSEYSQNANEWSDLDSIGVPILFKDLYFTYNYSVEECRDWWLETPLQMMENDVLDGVFVDKITKALFFEIFDEGGEPVNDYVRMLSDLYDAMPESKMLIGNNLRTERLNSNRALMEVMDGSYLERWAFQGTALSEAEAISISIQVMREALSKGKIIHFQTTPNYSGGEPPSEDYDAKVQYAKDNVEFPLAVYLIMAEENAFFSYQLGVNARSNVTDVWNTSFIDEFDYCLGAPLGPPTKDGYIYERSYEFVDVWVNVETKEAILDWKIEEGLPCDNILSSHNLSNTTINIYPNPATEEINISVGEQLEYEYFLYTLTGTLVTSSKNKSTIKVNSLSAGCYLLKIEDSQTGQFIIEKIIITH